MELLLASLAPSLVGLTLLSPILAAAIVGLVLSRRKLAGASPRAHARATLGWVFLLLHLVHAHVVRVVISTHAAQRGDRTAYTGWLTMVNLVSAALLLASAILLLQAILADRSGPASPTRVA